MRCPFEGDTAGSTMGAVLHEDPAPPRSLRHDIPAPLERIVMRCLEKQAEARFASADEVYQALLAQQNPKRPIKLKPRTAAIAAAILLLVAGGALAVRERIRAARILWVEKEAAPRIAQLIGKNRRLEALPLYQRAISYCA
jgi:hypothetical protein